jgi:hypothetical protein
VRALFRNFRFRKIRFSFSRGEGRAARGFFLLQLPSIMPHNNLIYQAFLKGEKSSEKSENPAEKT